MKKEFFWFSLEFIVGLGINIKTKTVSRKMLNYF